MKSKFRSILVLIAVVILVTLAMTFVNDMIAEQNALKYSEVKDKFEDGLVISFVINENGVLELTTIDPVVNATTNEYEYEKDENGNAKVKAKRDANGNITPISWTYDIGYSIQIEQIISWSESTFNPYFQYYDIKPIAGAPWWQAFLPYIIMALLFFGLWFFLFRQAPGGGKMNNFAKSKAKVSMDDKNAVKFCDVAGADEEKAELEEVVEFLKDPTKFIKLGARIPRGVLLVGPPGTGKTLLAKAVAGEAGVPFFSISGSDFVEMYVGVGASRVRDLFDNARKTQASIIFIDEIDAVGRHRGAGLGGGHDEREQTLNQLLVEMDGFGTNSGVIVMAATNRPDILDPALLRPGRFDRRVTVNYPDMNGREAILKVHCRNKPLEEGVDLRKIAQTTIGFTGAELANLMNEAALRAAKKNKALIGMEDIEESYMKLLLGPQKKSKLRTEEDNKLCAYHEAGHAVASYFCKHTDPIKHITIVPAGSAGGVTLSVPTEDRMTASKNQMIDRIVLALGGRVAEEIVLDDISTGASNDIQQATAIARNMVTRYGMSEKLGTVLYGSEHSNDAVFLGRDFSSGQNYSEKTAAEIDDEIRKIISDAYALCKKNLTDNIDKLHFVANFLIKNESMDEEQFKAAMEMENPTIESIEEIVLMKKNKSKEENKTQHEKNRAAEEEAKRKAEEEARLERERTQNMNGFSSEDFFKNVWQAPKNDSEDESEEIKDDSNVNENDSENN